MITSNEKSSLVIELGRMQWGKTGAPVIGDAVKAWCTENSQRLIETTVQALAGSAVQHLLQTMQSMRPY